MDFEPGNCTDGQMIVLQEQLVAAIIENQNLADQIRKLRTNGSTEKLLLLLSREKEKNHVLKEKIQENDDSKRMRDKSLPSRDKSPRSHSRGRFGWRRKGLEKSKSLDQSEFLSSLSADETSVDDTRNWRESNDLPTAQTDLATSTKKESPTPDSFWDKIRKWFLWKFFELIRDFSEVKEEEHIPVETEGDLLTVKKLKDNVLRFTTILKPFSDLSTNCEELLRWETPSATFFFLVIYMTALIYGYFFSSILVYGITRLSRNYLRKKGWSINLFGKKEKRENSETLDTSTDSKISDKFIVVLQVARRVQNILGTVSDGSEKLQNLLYWEHEFTRTLYLSLWLLLGASLFMRPSQMFSIVGIYLGIKMFIVDYIFFRFPRIRLKYDSTTRLWDTLPTDADLESRKYEKNGFTMVSDTNLFLALFNLPPTETPLPGWNGGKRITLVNRDKSITGAFKNGRLYLTDNYLCFERSKSHPSKNISIAICDVVTLDKANRYPWIPGGGMAIEVYIASGKVYFFGGIINRDEVFDAILDQCRKSGASIKKKEKEEEYSEQPQEKILDNLSDEIRALESDQNPTEILDLIH